MTVIETDRLLIRQIEQNDLEDLYAICGNEELMQFTGDGILSKELTQKWIEVTLYNYKTKGFGMYAVCDKSNHQFIGYCGLIYSKYINDNELIYALDKDFWGQGLATEMAFAMVQYGFTALKLEMIFASINPGNLASERILAKVGFKEAFRKKDEAGLDTIYYEIRA